MASQARVCVAGAGGYIASWLVKLLLSRGYAVHATVRDPDHPKNDFLKQLDGASENLRLFKADVLDYDSLTAAFAGCEGVFHPASPVPDGKLVDPENWYCLAKTEAEEMALEYGERNGLKVVTVLPGMVIGPMLQTERINLSVKAFQYIIKGGPDTMNKFWASVHVHDVADALLLVYEKPESSGRYICSLEQMDIKDMVMLLKSKYPNYGYVDKTVDVDYNLAVSSEKLRNLGWKPRSQEETLADALEYLEKAGLLNDNEPCRLPDFYRMNADAQE